MEVASVGAVGEIVVGVVAGDEVDVLGWEGCGVYGEGVGAAADGDGQGCGDGDVAERNNDGEVGGGGGVFYGVGSGVGPGDGRIAQRTATNRTDPHQRIERLPINHNNIATNTHIRVRRRARNRHIRIAPGPHTNIDVLAGPRSNCDGVGVGGDEVVAEGHGGGLGVGRGDEDRP